MNAQSPYNQNEELVAMKHDIADRAYGIQVKSWLMKGLTVGAGVLLGMLAAPTFGAAAVVIGGAVGLLGGGIVADMATMKDREKLKIDQSMVDSYMSGKNYWKEGYVKEVAEHGYSLSGPAIAGAVMPPQRPRGRE